LWHCYLHGAPKLTEAEKLVQEQMLALLEWAADPPKSWHPVGTLPETVEGGRAAGQSRRDRDSPAAESVPIKPYQ
jgi:hypothetical protein